MARKNSTADSIIPVWVQRLQALLEERDMKQSELAGKIGVAPSTVSDWLSETKGREPGVSKLYSIATVLWVSMDYLMGASECETAKNEEIHKRIGLSNKAIKKLIRLQRKVKANNLLAVKKVAVCNFLLETEDMTDLFDCLYNYLLGEYYFNDGQQDLSATAIYLKSPLGTSDERLNFAESFSYVYLSKITQELSLLKEEAVKRSRLREKKTYEEWKNTDAGKAVDLETLKDQAAYEDGEE